MKFFKDLNKEVFAFEDDVSQDILDSIINSRGLVTITEAEAKELTEPTAEEKIKLALEAISSSISKMLDDKAKEFRYDDIKSARASAGVPLQGTETDLEVTQYNEALALAVWERSVWSKSSEIEEELLEKVFAGEIEVPSFEEFEAQLPSFK